MAETTIATARPTDHKPHAAFFRQSGWLMMATIIGGLMSYGVHPLSKRIPNEQYSIFVTLLMVATCLPTTPLQMVFAQQTVSGLIGRRERQLAGMIRLISLSVFLLWTVAAVAALVFQGAIAARWNLSNPVALWITLATVLFSLWMPLFNGVLQGRQDFFWLGSSALVGNACRLAMAVVFVLVLGGGATGMMTAAMIGIGMGLAISLWRTRDLWWLAQEPFDVRALFRELLPLIFGFWACQFMFTTDMIFATAYFNGEEMAPYGAVGTLSRALMWVVLPLATVMFPKLVYSHAKAEKNTLLSIVLPGTALLAVGGAAGLWLLGPLVIKVVGKEEWVAPARVLLPWYAAALVPLALANVLANDLLARGRYRVVPFMVALAAGYGLAVPYALNYISRKPETILQVLGLFNLLLFVVCAWFAWTSKSAGPQRSKSACQAVKSHFNQPSTSEFRPG